MLVKIQLTPAGKKLLFQCKDTPGSAPSFTSSPHKSKTSIVSLKHINKLYDLDSYNTYNKIMMKVKTISLN